MSDQERRLAWEWADGRWLGDSWLEHLRRALESEAHFLAETERLRAALTQILETEPVAGINLNARVNDPNAWGWNVHDIARGTLRETGEKQP